MPETTIASDPKEQNTVDLTTLPHTQPIEFVPMTEARTAEEIQAAVLKMMIEGEGRIPGFVIRAGGVLTDDEKLSTVTEALSQETGKPIASKGLPQTQRIHKELKGSDLAHDREFHSDQYLYNDDDGDIFTYHNNEKGWGRTIHASPGPEFVSNYSDKMIGEVQRTRRKSLLTDPSLVSPTQHVAYVGPGDKTVFWSNGKQPTPHEYTTLSPYRDIKITELAESKRAA